MDGNIEDSATAEISRFQVWQWIKHNQELEAHCDTEFSLYGFIKVFYEKNNVCNSQKLKENAKRFENFSYCSIFTIR